MCNFCDFLPSVRKKCIFANKTTGNMEIETREIEIRDLRPNDGEVEGLPRNPRKISKKNLEKLKKSVQDAPEMLRLRELIVVPHGGGYVVIAGNQRLEAAKAVGMETLPCKVLPEDTDPAKLREYAIKDNLPFGEDDWEVLTTEWDPLELSEWGLECKAEQKTSELSKIEFSDIYYKPSRFENLTLKDCIDTSLFDKKSDFIEKSKLTKEQKQTMKMFAYRFLKIDFEAVADYYTHNASDEEREVLARLRMVLLDSGNIDGFIQDDLLRIIKAAE